MTEWGPEEIAEREAEQAEAEIDWAAGHTQGQTPEPCFNCLGEKGEWIDRKDPRNSTYLQDNDDDEFVPCRYCNGTGERPTGRKEK